MSLVRWKIEATGGGGEGVLMRLVVSTNYREALGYWGTGVSGRELVHRCVATLIVRMVKIC